MNKKLFFYIGIFSFLVAFTSCNKNELEDLNTKVDDLQTSLDNSNEQFYSLLDSIVALDSNTQTDEKALKMETIGYLFESMSRQPEASADLVSATAILYNDYTELLPLTDKAVLQRAAARGEALGMMFSAIARQPEMAEEIDSTAERFLGVYNSEYINDEMLSYSKTIAVKYLLDGIARQPEITPIFNTLSKKYLNYEFLVETAQ